jgi:tyrosine-protein phosphatase YwqE
MVLGKSHAFEERAHHAEPARESGTSEKDD